MSYWADQLGTSAASFGIGLGTGRAILSTAGLSAARTLTLPNKNGTLACTSDVPVIGTDVQAWSAALDNTSLTVGACNPNDVFIGKLVGSGNMAVLSLAANRFLARASTGTIAGKVITDDALALVADTSASAKLVSLTGLAQTVNFIITGGTGDAFDAIALTANRFLARASTGNMATQIISDDSLTFLAAANFSAMRTALGLSSMATQSSASVAISGGSAALTSATIGLANLTNAVVDVAYRKIVAPPAKAAAVTLTIAELLGGNIRYTGATATLTSPTGTLIEAGIITAGQTNYGFSFTITNSGAGVCTLGMGVGCTAVDGMTVAAGQSQVFSVRRTGLNAYSIYRG